MALLVGLPKTDIKSFINFVKISETLGRFPFMGMKALLFYILFVHTVVGQGIKEQIDAPQLGKVCPDIFLPIMTSMGTKSVRLSDYRGKVVVLEFWATSCRPCIPAMDNFEILEAGFPNQLKVFEITTEDRERVERFLQKHASGATIVLDADKQLQERFYHNFLPHTVLIDPKGVVRAFTSPSEVTSGVIRKLLQGKEIKVRSKQELEAQMSVSSELSRNLNAAETTLFEEEQYVRVEAPKRAKRQESKVIFSTYQEGKEAEIYREEDYYLSFVNCPITLMYESLYEISSSRVLLEVPDDHVERYTFDKQNAYCFELSLADSMQTTIQKVGIQELEKRFPLRSRLENRSRDVWVLQKTGKAVTATKHENNRLYGTFNDLLAYLENFPDLSGMPLVNETGIKDNEAFDWEVIKKQPGTLDQRLAALGLKRVHKTKEITCLILYEVGEK